MRFFQEERVQNAFRLLDSGAMNTSLSEFGRFLKGQKSAIMT